MKAIMTSNKPKWCAKIMNGEKTIDVRTTAPKKWKDYLSGKRNEIPEPMECLIYCTKEERLEYLYDMHDDIGEYLSHKGKTWEDEDLSGKVVAKFTLNKVEEIIFGTTLFNDLGFFTGSLYSFNLYKQSCLTKEEMQNCLNVKPNGLCGYAWHISNLEIFDEPKELSEFTNGKYIFAKNYKLEYYKLTKAPRSWCYVEKE